MTYINKGIFKGEKHDYNEQGICVITGENKNEILKQKYTDDDENDLINWYKNHLLITNFLKARNIPYTWNGCFLMDDVVDDENRFDGNYGDFREFSVDGKHATAEHNEKYAKKLYNFILKNEIIDLP